LHAWLECFLGTFLGACLFLFTDRAIIEEAGLCNNKYFLTSHTASVIIRISQRKIVRNFVNLSDSFTNC